MRLVVDVGHNVKFDEGCRGLESGKSEDELARELGELVINGLRTHGHFVFESKPISASSLFNSLWQRAKFINRCSINYFLSLHFNCGGGSGVEIYYKGKRGKQFAELLLEKIKQATGLEGKLMPETSLPYLLRHSYVAGVQVEVCYCDSEHDMALYNAEKVSHAIISAVDEIAKIKQKRNRKKRSANEQRQNCSNFV
jgi:N-acetylmuramoyl-L-alanine amidase